MAAAVVVDGGWRCRHDCDGAALNCACRHIMRWHKIAERKGHTPLHGVAKYQDKTSGGCTKITSICGILGNADYKKRWLSAVVACNSAHPAPRHATLRRLAQARPPGEQPSTDMSSLRRPSSAGGAAVDNGASLLSPGRLRRRVVRAAQTTPGSGGDDVILPQSPTHRRIRRGWCAEKDDSSGRRFLRSRRLRR